jgi:hypothetical protein
MTHGNCHHDTSRSYTCSVGLAFFQLLIVK